MLHPYLPRLLAFFFLLAGSVRAQDTFPPLDTKFDDAKSLERLFRYGLPDSRGARWIHVTGMDCQMPMIAKLASEPDPLIGNAWLMHEHADGTVDLIIGQAHRIKARRLDAPAKPETAALPGIWIAPADLAWDWRRLEALLASNTSGTSPGEKLSTSADQATGEMLLFLAHLQRQGKMEEAQRGFVLMRNIAGANRMIEETVVWLADSRLLAAATAFSFNGEIKNYAEAVETLLAQFPPLRDWPGRDDAERLLARLKTPPSAVDAADARAVGEILLGLNQEQHERLRSAPNWLLWRPEDWRKASANIWNVPHAEDPLPPLPEPLLEWFARPQELAAALTGLLDDRHFSHDVDLKFQADRFGQRYSYWSPYAELRGGTPSPTELREVAENLLEKVLPPSLRQSDTTQGIAEADRGKIRAWLETVTKLRGEELAWHLLRNAKNSNDPAFVGALRYLAARESAETLAALEPIFCDPETWAAWDLGHIGYFFPDLSAALKDFLKRFPGDRNAFGNKLLAAIEKAAKIEDGRYLAGTKNGEYLAEAQRVRLTKIRLLFEPPDLSKALAAFLSETADDYLPLAEFFTQAGVLPPAEGDAILYPAIAGTKDPWKKRSMLDQLFLASYDTPKPPSTPFAPAVAAAVLALLDDPSMSHLRPWSSGIVSGRPAADMIARVVALPHLSPREQAEWRDCNGATVFTERAWQRAAARAVATNQPVPPRPDPTLITPAERDALITDLAALPPEKIRTAFDAMAPDQQAAIRRHLSHPDTVWPPSFTELHLAVTLAQKDLPPGLDAKRWEGRRFGEPFAREVMAAMEKAARAGKNFTVVAESLGPLDGVKLFISLSHETFDEWDMGLLRLKKAPRLISLVMHQHLGGNERISYSSQEEQILVPIWKDPALTQKWKQDHKTVESAWIRSSGALDQLAADIAALKPAGRAEFHIQWTAMPVKLKAK